MAAVLLAATGCVTDPQEAADADPCAPQRTAIYQPPVTLGGAGQVQIVETPSPCPPETKRAADDRSQKAD